MLSFVEHTKTHAHTNTPEAGLGGDECCHHGLYFVSRGVCEHCAHHDAGAPCGVGDGLAAAKVHDAEAKHGEAIVRLQHGARGLSCALLQTQGGNTRNANVQDE